MDNQATTTALGEFDRLTGALFDPKAAFADIAARPRWWVPLVLLALLVLGFLLAFSQRVGWESFMRQQFETNPRAQQLSAERREEILQQQLRFVPIVAPVQGVVALGVAAVVIAAVFMLVFNVLLGTQLTFRQFFAITCYGLLPLAVGTVVSLGVLFLKDPSDFDLQNPVASNLAAFLDPSTAPAWLTALAKSFDVFTIWCLLLFATGFSVAARKITWAKAFTWVVVTWGVWVVLRVGWNGIFG